MPNMQLAKYNIFAVLPIYIIRFRRRFMNY